jgi:hypothetical protein
MNFRSIAKKYAPVVVGSVAMAAGSAFAIDSADINAAVTDGKTVVGLVVAGVVAVSALGFGLNMIKGLISK